MRLTFSDTTCGIKSGTIFVRYKASFLVDFLSRLFSLSLVLSLSLPFVLAASTTLGSPTYLWHMQKRSSSKQRPRET